MPRVKIDLPSSFLFETEISVRISDINYGGHLGNDSLLSMIHEARFRFLNQLGYKDEISIDGFGLIQADTAIVYKGEAFHGDKIKVEVAITEISRKSFDMVYNLTSESKTIAHAKTGMVMFDYKESKVVNIPEAFLSKIQA